MVQRFTIPRRMLIAAGALALVVLGATLGLPSAWGEGRTSLILKCDPADVPAVLDRLRGMDVEVYDLESMAPVPVPPVAPATATATPARPTPALPADGLVVLDRLQEAARQVAASAGSRPPLRMLRMDVKSRGATILVRASAPEDLDALVQTLTQDAVLSSRRRAARWVHPGGVKRVEDGWEQVINLRFTATGSAETLREGPFLTLQTINDHLNRQRGKMTYLSAQHTRRDDVREIVTQKLQVELATVEQLMAFLRAIDAEPGIVIEEISWSYDDDAAEAGRLRKTQISVSALYARPPSK